MFPDSPQANQIVQQTRDGQTPGDTIIKQFVGETRSQLATLSGEIALRNRVIQQNDAYIYGDLLTRTLDIPVGHDMTPVNWLRRTVEIHRTQFMGKGFHVVSAYESLDSDVDDPQQQQMLQLENTKRKANAEKRRQLIDAIIRDNGGKTLYAQLAENASAIGAAVLKCWYDQEKGKYITQIVEAVEHVYALWKRDSFREYDAIAYVYQVSKQDAQRAYGVGPNVATSPLGMPLAVLSTANTVEYISTQPMVTIMEVCGKIQGWSSKNGVLSKCKVGDETEMCAVIVGNDVYQLFDDPKYMPHYYIFPNKLVRRRPWGIPDVTQAAVNINQTYIEALSDWRTLASKANFPKFKYLNFSLGSNLPQPKARKVEGIPLSEGQDIQPINMSNSAELGEKDFMNQMEELQNQFVREVGIGRVLFDTPDVPMNSGQAIKGASQSMGDIVTTKRQLWEPILTKMFTTAFKTLSYFDDGIKQVYEEDSGWFLRVRWPGAMGKDDPTFQTMMLNRFNAGLISIQSYMEQMGETKEELDRIVDEMSQKETAIIHGHQMSMMAEYMILPPLSAMPPKVNLNLRGDLTPNQVGDIAAARGIVTDQSPFPNTVGPQGNEGLKAEDNVINQGMIKNAMPNEPTAIQLDNTGRPVPPMVAGGQSNATLAGAGGSSQQTAPTNGQQGQPMISPGGVTGPMTQPGTGAPAASNQGTVNKRKQHGGS
jgi:hypothetical protein